MLHVRLTGLPLFNHEVMNVFLIEAWIVFKVAVALQRREDVVQRSIRTTVGSDGVPLAFI